MSTRPAGRTFTLDEAHEVLPLVRRLTADAVERFEAVSVRLHALDESEPQHATLAAELQAIAAAWVAAVRELEVEVKGLWLVDFDNGEGYYCWAHPEPSITHFHGYDDGFAGRMKIV